MMCLCCPTTKPSTVRWLKALKNAGVNVKKASPPDLAATAVKMALPPNRVVATAKIVKPPSSVVIIAKKANAPKHVMVTGRSPPHKKVGTVRARSNEMIGRSNEINGAMENPARGKTPKKDFLYTNGTAHVLLTNFCGFL